MDQVNPPPKTVLLLLVLFATNALLVLATYPFLFAYYPSPPGWIYVVRAGIFAGQLFTLSLVGALAQTRRWLMWLLLLPFALILTLGFLPEADPNFWLLGQLPDEFNDLPSICGRLLLLVLANFHAPMCMMLAGILLMSVIFWPAKVFFGWQLIGRGRGEFKAKRVSTLQLLLWIGLWSALFFIYTQVRMFYGTEWVVWASIAVPIVLIGALPVAICCACTQSRWYFYLAVPVYVLALSYGESELSYFIASLTPRGGTGITIVYPLCLNSTIASVVAGNLMIMRAFGLRLHTPFRRSTKAAADTVAGVHSA